MQIEKEPNIVENSKKQVNFKMTKTDENYFKRHEALIVKIQKWMRGFLTRKHLGPEYRVQRREGSGQSIKGIQRPMRKEISVVPDYSNPETRATEQRVGPFKYVKPSSESDRDLEDRGPYELDNEAIYIGQWSKDGV